MSVACLLLGIVALGPADPQRSGSYTSGYSSYGEYGPPEPVALEEVASGGESYQRRNVLTKGELRGLGGQLAMFELVDGTARLLVIPVEGLADGPRRLIGRRVEVTGIIRTLPSNQQTVMCRGARILESKCADPDLPALPNAQLQWPGVSITILTISEVGASAREAPRPEGLDLADLVAPDTSYAGQDVRVIGLFGGHNLFGDLPAGSSRTPRDWVLRQPPHAIWVTGRKPEGKGWKLDPAYKGDAVRWVEVTGRVEVANGVPVLRASKVLLTTPPKPPEPEP